MLNFRDIFSYPIGKTTIMQIIAEIEIQPSDFQQIFDLIFDKDTNIAWRAAWVADHICRKHKNWFSMEMKVKLMKFSQTVIKNGHLRLCLSILLNAGLSVSVSGDFINFCFENIKNNKTSVAVKVLSVKILSEICKKEPDLQNEVEIVLQDIDMYICTSGIKSVVKNFFLQK